MIQLQSELINTEVRVKRISSMVEDGFVEMEVILNDRVTSLNLDRDRLTVLLERIRTYATPAADIPLAVIDEFGRMMRESISTGEIQFRKVASNPSLIR